MAPPPSDDDRIHDLHAAAAELEARNRDNVSRTASYLALYAWTRRHPPELPWLLMAHLVSRNSGYLMSDLARRIDELGDDAAMVGPMTQLFLLLERGNFLIFWDAWFHVTAQLRGTLDAAPPGRVSRFMREAWAGFAARGAPSNERQLVLDLVHNEQHFIERRVVHHADFAMATQLIGFIEAAGRERPLHFPFGRDDLRVGGFARLAQRIATGARIFDEVVAPERERLFAWAEAHSHTGSRAVAGGRATPEIRAAWPRERVAALSATIWDGPAPDPDYP